MRKGTLKASAAQVTRRREKVTEWSRAGYPVEAIAVALGVGVPTVVADRRVMRAYLPDGRLTSKRSRSTLPPLQPYNWKAEPPSPLAAMPPWQRTSPVRAVSTLLESLKESNSRNRMAHNVRDALSSGDEGRAWLSESDRLLTEAIGYLQEMKDTITDAETRDTVITTRAGRDDLTGRVVFAPASRALPLPPKDTGQMPGLVYAELWRRWWAGIPFDQDVIMGVAATLKSAPPRVEAAAQEFTRRVT